MPKLILLFQLFVYNFRLFVYNFRLFVYIFQKQIWACQTHFGFTNVGSDMHIFRVIAIWSSKFWFDSPCTHFFVTFEKFERLLNLWYLIGLAIMQNDWSFHTDWKKQRKVEKVFFNKAQNFHVCSTSVRSSASIIWTRLCRFDVRKFSKKWCSTHHHY